MQFNPGFKSAVIIVAAALGAACATPSRQAGTAAVDEGRGDQAARSSDANDGRIVGIPAPNSKFAKLRLGMSLGDVDRLIGGGDDQNHYPTGKGWIPFYFGSDTQRIEVLYRGEGCLTFTGGNQFGGGHNDLIRIEVDSAGRCFKA